MHSVVNFVASNSIYLVVASVLFNIRKLNKEQTVFAYYVLWLLVLENINTWAVYVLHFSIWVWDFGLLVELFFLTWFYRRFAYISKESAKRYNAATLLVTGITIYKYFIARDYNNINYNLIILMILTIMISGAVLLNIFGSESLEFNKSFVFWISFVRLFYLMMILPFNVSLYLGSYINDKESMSLYYSIDRNVNYFANIVFNLVLAFSFTCRK